MNAKKLKIKILRWILKEAFEDLGTKYVKYDLIT
jgi:hypothetical protein